MQPFHTVVPAGGGTTEDYAHPGEEFGFVLAGELTLKLGSRTHKLETGTAVYFSSLIPHSWTNEA
jgi:quercetin dioxygenase-like cupin family protein